MPFIPRMRVPDGTEIPFRRKEPRRSAEFWMREEAEKTEKTNLQTSEY
jgi:hypothetical protein